MGVFQKAAEKLTSEKMGSRSRKRLIVFIAVITLLSMTTSTVAWFTINTFAGVSSLDVHISVAAQLKVGMSCLRTTSRRSVCRTTTSSSTSASLSVTVS